jgi:hypothetical protein
MAKELPYFRFTVQEWQNGDISLESYELKGLFIDVCGFYWIKDCSINLALLEKRFSNARDLLKQLINIDVIKVDEYENISIDFLNDQFDLLSEKRKKRQEAGRKGGLAKSSNAKELPEQSSSYKDKDKEKDNNNKKAFAADANRDEKGYRLYFFNLVKEREVSRDQLFLKAKVNLSLRNELWADFIENSIIHTPLIEDEKHAWNTFKKFIQDNGKNYSGAKRKTGSETFDGF